MEMETTDMVRRGVRAAVCLSLVLGLSTTVEVWAQAVDLSDFVFDDTTVPTVRIWMSDSDLDLLFEPGNQYSDDELPAVFQFEKDGQIFREDSVGFRFRGNTSRDSQKKSFKVSFNTFRTGNEFFDLEKLNLNGEHNDPSLMRAKISWDLFNEVGIPASRANHVELFINDAYYGLYLNVEHVDEKFLARHFGNADGNLYKCLWPADLQFLGTDPGPYRPTDASRRPYDLKLKDDDLSAYDDLARFIAVLNTTDDSQFVDEIEKLFEASGFVEALALTVLLGSWDSYWFLKNNYYLYSNPSTGKFHYIPFDFDNTMGIWWDGIYPGLDWMTRDIYEWGHPQEPRPLTDRFLATRVFRDRYSFYLRRLLDHVFQSNSLTPAIMARRDQIQTAALADTFRTKDYGFTERDFFDSYTGGLTDHPHVVEGIVPFIGTRAQTAASQLEVVDISPIISRLDVSPDRARVGSEVRFTVKVEDETPNPTVELHYWPSEPTEHILTMSPAPQYGRHMYESIVTVSEGVRFIDYLVTASDHAGQVSSTKLETLGVSAAAPLFINEFMASNQTTIRDPANETDDWIELYNGGTSDLALAGFFLTDTLGIPLKWALPDTTIPPGGFVLVWADEDGMQGPMHANFRLARAGEVVAIFDQRLALIDSVSFGVQLADISYGRLPDGGPSFTSFTSPTPGTSNGTGVGIDAPDIVQTEFEISAFPNPSRGAVALALSRALSEVAVEVFDVLGRRVAVFSHADRGTVHLDWDGRAADGASLPAGVYVVRARGLTSKHEEVSRSIPIVRLR